MVLTPSTPPSIRRKLESRGDELLDSRSPLRSARIDLVNEWTKPDQAPKYEREIMKVFASIVFSIVLVASPAFIHANDDSGAKKETPELIGLRYFLEEGDSALVDFVMADVDRILKNKADRPGVLDRARKEIREVFERNWITGEHPTSLTIKHFDMLEKKCLPFGRNRLELVEILEGRDVPSAWDNENFIKWVGVNLPPKIAGMRTLDRFLSHPPPGDRNRFLERYAFLLEVTHITDVKTLQHFFNERWNDSAPLEIRDWCNQMVELSNMDCLARFGALGERARILRRFSNRLLKGIPVDRWLEVGEPLESIIRRKKGGPDAFLKKAADYFRDKKNIQKRTDENGGLLANLCEYRGLRNSYAILRPDEKPGWFIWLHQQGVIQQIHDDEKNRGVVAGRKSSRSLETLIRFVDEGYLYLLFPYIEEHYYNLFQDKVFKHILRPQGKGDNKNLVLEAALQPSFFSDHRALLAIDNLGNGGGFSRAWEEGRAPMRLDFAIDIYTNLLNEPRGSYGLKEHVSHPLLEDILLESLRLFMKEGKKEEIVSRLKEIGAHLNVCQSIGADLSNSKPLKKTVQVIDQEVSAHLEVLKRKPSETMVLGPREKQAIKLFARELGLLFDLRNLMRDVIEKDSNWTRSIRSTLKNEIFGLKNEIKGKTMYWEPSIVEFRSELLRELDGPLRRCLAGKNKEDFQSFFHDIYLPLVRVHGFLKTSRAANPTGYPHLAWIRERPENEKRELVAKLFEELKTDRWLDAEEVVSEFALMDKRLRFRGENFFHISPGGLFAGKWSVNANIHVYKRILESEEAILDRESRLGDIANVIVQQLKENRPPVGPVYPISGAPPRKDALQSPWRYAKWAFDFIQAAEWTDHPFLDGNNKTCSWRERLSFSKRDNPQFQFKLKGNEVFRKVDGTRREDLVKILLEHLPQTPPGKKSAKDQEKRIQHTIQLAEMAMFLPNHNDNLVGNSKRLRNYREMRQKIYGKLRESLMQFDDDDNTLLSILRHMMLLHVSTRSTSPLSPDLGRVITDARNRWAENNQMLEEGINDILLEKEDLLSIIKGEIGNDIEAFRIFIDRKIKAFMPESWLKGDVEFRNRTYKRRLATLDDYRIKDFLQIGDRMDRLVETGKADILSKEKIDNLPKDFKRMQGVLNLIDYTLFFSRPDFKPRKYIDYIKRSDSNDWWPALVALACFNTRLRDDMLDYCYKIRRLAPGFDETIRSVIYQIFYLNEAVFGVVERISNHSRREEILNFNHEIVYESINFRILAKQENTTIASAASLGKDAFRAVASNIKIIKDEVAPNDNMLYGILFQETDEFLPEELERPKTAIDYTLDKTIRMADQWISDVDKPEVLRKSANAFFSEGVYDRTGWGLLEGAATTRGVVKPLLKIMENLADSSSDRYREFYDGMLTEMDSEGRSRLSERMILALIAPFYRVDSNGEKPDAGIERSRQKADFETLLASWRKTPGEAESESRFIMAMREDFGRILANLLRWEAPGNEQSYFLWKPVVDLKNEKGILNEPPEDFLDLCHWFFNLPKPEDPAEIRAFFDTEQEAVP